jgi:hypothetical protein
MGAEAQAPIRSRGLARLARTLRRRGRLINARTREGSIPSKGQAAVPQRMPLFSLSQQFPRRDMLHVICRLRSSSW